MTYFGFLIFNCIIVGIAALTIKKWDYQAKIVYSIIQLHAQELLC
jgi:hypothetical protein